MEKKKKEQDKSDKQKEFEPRECDSAAAGCWYWREGFSTKADRDFLAVLVSIVCLYRRGYWILQGMRMNHMAGDFDDCQKENRKIGNDGPSSLYLLYTQGSAGSVP